MGLSDFSPLSQDSANTRVEVASAYPARSASLMLSIDAGISGPSLPGFGYGQHEYSLERLLYEHKRAHCVLCDEDKTWYERVVLKSRAT